VTFSLIPPSQAVLVVHLRETDWSPCKALFLRLATPVTGLPRNFFCVSPSPTPFEEVPFVSGWHVPVAKGTSTHFFSRLLLPSSNVSPLPFLSLKRLSLSGHVSFARSQFFPPGRSCPSLFFITLLRRDDLKLQLTAFHDMPLPRFWSIFYLYGFFLPTRYFPLFSSTIPATPILKLDPRFPLRPQHRQDPTSFCRPRDHLFCGPPAPFFPPPVPRPFLPLWHPSFKSDP